MYIWTNAYEGIKNIVSRLIITVYTYPVIHFEKE